MFVQTFTETELTGKERYLLTLREYVTFSEVATIKHEQDGVSDWQAKLFAVGFAMQSIITIDEKLNTNRTAIVYCDDEKLTEHIRFRPLLNRDHFLRRLIERINYLQRRHKIIVSYGKWFEVKESNKELWRKVYSIQDVSGIGQSAIKHHG